MTDDTDLTTIPDFEQLLLMLCRQTTGDVHLDLSELDGVDIGDVITMLRGAAILDSGRHLVLHNPPSAVQGLLEVLGPDVGSACRCLD